ncbi:hypothetical protein K488DRAFT_68738 [Vararia minispora EC-137]|uniref:Uncharacterized protein n=1 Tax=Vararia minispora EC-137 TaxID=1314806 RepID=A0ACB8QT53_9AGAM|nr:hypothetical protein K488DRAFT_68738 [Vararia minispora EC-137]
MTAMDGPPITPSTTSTGLMEGALSGLEALEAVSEAVDAHPPVRYIASVSLLIVRIGIENDINDDMFWGLALHAKDAVLNIAQFSEGVQGDVVQELELELVQVTAFSPFSPPWQIIEGIYIIRNASSGRVLEVEDAKSGSGVHVYLSPSRDGRLSTQLWYIKKKIASQSHYFIQSLALGSVLDIWMNSPHSGAHVVAHGPNGGGNQTWVFFGSRENLLLQNISSGLFATVTTQADLHGANVVLQPAATSSTEWSFLHTMQIDHDPDMFAITTFCLGSHATLGHWSSKYINVSKFAPTNPHHSWIVIPQDGVFLLRNRGSGHLLSASSRAPVDTVLTTREALSNPACQWRLIDAVSGETCRVVYDSTLSILPPELSGSSSSRPDHISSVQRSPGELLLHTSCATEAMQADFIDGLQVEHELLRNLFRSGCSTVVVAPRVMTWWHSGRVSRMRLSSEPEYDGDAPHTSVAKPNRRMDVCFPRAYVQ